MIENCSSILEILAALYITLAFDDVLKHFVQGFSARNKLSEILLNNSINNKYDDNEDIKKAKKIVDGICDDFVETFSKFAPIFIYLSLAMLYIISFNNMNGSTNINIMNIGTKLSLVGLILFAVFLMNKKLFNRFVVCCTIFLLIIVTFILAKYSDSCYLEKNLGIDYTDDAQHIIFSIGILLILSLPFDYMIFHSWLYPKLCYDYLKYRIELKLEQAVEIRRIINSEDGIGYYNSHSNGYSASANDLETYKSLLKDKSLCELYSCACFYQEELAKIRGNQDKKINDIIKSLKQLIKTRLTDQSTKQNKTENT